MRTSLFVAAPLLASAVVASPLSLANARKSLQQVFAPAAPAQQPDAQAHDFVDVLLAEAAKAQKQAAQGFNADAMRSALVTAPGGWAWTSCGDDGDAVEVKSISVSPDPPQPGKNLTVVASGTVRNEVKAGSYADVVVKLGLIKLLTRRFDVCEEAERNGAELRCPVAEGDYTITQTVALPKEIPPAIFKIHVDGETADEQPLLCLDLSIDFLHR